MFLNKPLLIFLVFCLIGCASHKRHSGPPVLTSINIIDRNGMSETISHEERLKQFEQVDFLKPQPYQKVMRVYSRDVFGNLPAEITSYHPNGQIKQYLQVINNQAHGLYQEWHPNGCLKLEACVIGGTADISVGAEKTWLFEGVSKAWNECGQLVAEIPYSKGDLDGVSIYYHSSGNLWKKIPFCKNSIHGTVEIFLDQGCSLQTIEYISGIKHGTSRRYWNGEALASEEFFFQGLLKEGVYLDSCGNKVSSIQDGFGYRALFGKEGVAELQEYRQGAQEGEVRVFNTNNLLTRLYHVKNGEMHGEDIEYYDLPCLNSKKTPKLSINWYEGVIQGRVKTWYDSGGVESQREMSENKKNGLLTAWYRDGSLMLIEEYDHDKLVKGEYFKRGDKTPISEVTSGRGTATLFDPEGNFLKKIAYDHGSPV